MLLKHTFIYAVARGLPGIITFLSIAIYTRFLEPHEYGKYSLVMIVATLMNSVLYQWIRLGLLRFLPSTKEEEKKGFKSSIITSFLMVSAVTVVAGAVACAIFPSLWIYVLFTLVILWSQSWFEMTQTLYRTELKPIRFGYITLIKTLATLALSVAFLFAGLEDKALLLGIASGTLISLAAVSAKDWMQGTVAIVQNKETIFTFVRYGIPLTVTFAFASIIQSTDRFLLGLFGSAKDTGLYAVASDFTQQTILMIMMLVNMSAFPLVVQKLEKEGREAANKQLEQNIVLILMVSLPAMFGIMALASNIAGVFFGSAYRETAVDVIPIVIIGMFFLGIKSYYCDLSFQLGKNTKKQFIPVLMAAIVNVGMNLLLIPQYGVLGAAYSNLTAYFISLIVSGIYAHKSFPLPFPLRPIAQIFVAAAGMALVLIPISHYEGVRALSIQVVIGMLVYFAAIYSMNVKNIRTEAKKFFIRKKQRQQQA